MRFSYFFEEKGDREQACYAKRARADGAIHYFYPLTEFLPEEKKQKKYPYKGL